MAKRSGIVRRLMDPDLSRATGCSEARASFETALRAPQDEGGPLGIKEIPHPEEAAKAAVSKDAQAEPGDVDFLTSSCRRGDEWEDSSFPWPDPSNPTPRCSTAGFDAFWTAELEAEELSFIRGASRGDRAMAEGARNSMFVLHRRWACLENECHRLGVAIGVAREAGADVTLLRDRQARLLLEISAVVAEIRDAPIATLYDHLALLDVAIEHETDLSIDMAYYGPSDFPMLTRLLRGLARRSLSSPGEFEQAMGEEGDANGLAGVHRR
jgi:hypothetical protein